MLLTEPGMEASMGNCSLLFHSDFSARLSLQTFEQDTVWEGTEDVTMYEI